MIVNWKTDLLNEKSLYAVFRESAKLTKSKSNKVIFWLSFVLSALICSKWVYSQDVNASAISAIYSAEIAFDLCVQILGFLIGGFAIFATVSDPKLMTSLASVKLGEKSISVFKYIFFNFLSVFYIYVCVLGCSIFIKILSKVESINIYHFVYPESANYALAVVNSLIFLSITSGVVIAVLRLKSFIWNIYQAFITFLIASDTIERK